MGRTWGPWGALGGTWGEKPHQIICKYIHIYIWSSDVSIHIYAHTTIADPRPRSQVVKVKTLISTYACVISKISCNHGGPSFNPYSVTPPPKPRESLGAAWGGTLGGLGGETFRSGSDRGRIGSDRDRIGSDRIGIGSDRIGIGSDRIGADRIGSGSDRIGADRIGVGSDRIGSGPDRIG